MKFKNLIKNFILTIMLIIGLDVYAATESGQVTLIKMYNNDYVKVFLSGTNDKEKGDRFIFYS